MAVNEEKMMKMIQVLRKEYVKTHNREPNTVVLDKETFRALKNRHELIIGRLEGPATIMGMRVKCSDSKGLRVDHIVFDQLNEY
jgi:hypothetical protein